MVSTDETKTPDDKKKKYTCPILWGIFFLKKKKNLYMEYLRIIARAVG